MSDLGHITLLLAFTIALYSVIAAVLSAVKKYPALTVSARNAILSVFVLYSLGLEIMLYAFLTDDFSVRIVAENSGDTLPMIYKFSALYSSKGGSLFFWGWLISAMTAIWTLKHRRSARQSTAYTIAALAAVQVFFLLLSSIVADIFETTPPSFSGPGLNPSFQTLSMLFHPILLFLGFAGFALVFGVTMGALLSGNPDSQWSTSTRRWALIAWCALGIGNLVGGWWAYTEQNWGGYWAWDPVENAGLMPWLLGTALIHSIAIHRKRGYLTKWTTGLALITFAFTLLSPFITHGGIESPLHGFKNSPFLPYFVGFLIIVPTVSMGIMVIRRQQLSDPHSAAPRSLVSREGTFLATNLILIIITIIVLAGTLAPLGDRITIERGFFDWGAGPILLVLVFFMGICPLLRWRKSSADVFRRNFWFPSFVSIMAAIIILAAGIGNWYAVAALVCGFPLMTIFQEWFRGTRTRCRIRGENCLRAFPLLVWGNRPRYGGMVVHVGIIIITLGVIGSSLYSIQKEATLKHGQSMEIEGYELTFDGLNQRTDAQKLVTVADIIVKRGDKKVTVLSPEMNLWLGPMRYLAEPAIRTTPADDLFVTVTSYDKANGSVTLRATVNPLVLWIWVGGGFLLLGGIIAFWPERRSGLNFT